MITKLVRRRSLRLMLATIVLPLLSLFAMAGTAGAATTSSGNPNIANSTSGQQLICSVGQSPGTTNANYLPVMRWSGAVSDVHTRLSGGINVISSAPNQVTRQYIDGTMLSIGNAEWSLATSTTDMAGRFCFGSGVGATLDSVAASVGNTVMGSGIIVVLVIVGIVVAIWRASRGRAKPFAQVVKMLIVLGIMVAMVAAATADSNSASSQNGQAFQPSFPSPAWVITTTYNTVGLVADAPAAAISGLANGHIGGVNSNAAIASQDVMDCSSYTNGLVTKYQAQFPKGNNVGYVVPEAMNSLWMQSALPAYEESQFGASNNFSPLVYCHLLEDNAGIPPAQQMNIALGSNSALAAANSSQPTNPNALAWGAAASSKMVDESLSAWAACQSTGGSGFLTPAEWSQATGNQIASEWTAIPNNGQNSNVTKVDCTTFWSGNSNGVGSTATGGNGGGQAWITGTGSSNLNSNTINNADLSPFNWGTDNDAVNSSVAAVQPPKLLDPSVGVSAGYQGQGMQDYIGTFHGNNLGGGLATAFVFLISSTIMMVIFLLLSGTLLIAKLSLLISIMILPIMLLISLVPGQDESKLLKYAKHVLSLAIFATCAGLLIGIIAITTSLIADVGTAAAGQGSLIGIIWVGLAPIGALWAVHAFFEKVIKTTSPLTPKGALAYAGIAGGLAGAGLEGLAKRGRGATQKGGGAKNNAASDSSAAGTGAPGSSKSAQTEREGGMGLGKPSRSHIKEVKRHNAEQEKQKTAETAKGHLGAAADAAMAAGHIPESDAGKAIISKHLADKGLNEQGHVRAPRGGKWRTVPVGAAKGAAHGLGAAAGGAAIGAGVVAASLTRPPRETLGAGVYAARRAADRKKSGSESDANLVRNHHATHAENKANAEAEAAAAKSAKEASDAQKQRDATAERHAAATEKIAAATEAQGQPAGRGGGSQQGGSPRRPSPPREPVTRDQPVPDVSTAPQAPTGPKE